MEHLVTQGVVHSLAASSAGGLILLYLALYVVFSLGVYGAFQKAGQPGWAAFVPIYSFYILLKVAGRPTTWTWFILLPIVPILGSIAFLVVSIIVLNDVSKSFGHGAGFTVGLVLLSVIFWYILWLGSSRYRGPAGPAGRSSFPQTGYAPPPPPPSSWSGQAPPPPVPPPPPAPVG